MGKRTYWIYYTYYTSERYKTLLKRICYLAIDFNPLSRQQEVLSVLPRLLHCLPGHRVCSGGQILLMLMTEGAPLSIPQPPLAAASGTFYIVTYFLSS